MRKLASRSRLLFALVSVCTCACGSDDGGSRPPVAVLGAFPAELAALLEQTTVEATTSIAGRNFRIGTINSVAVVVGMTGIGLVNAATTTRALLAQMEVSGVVVSGVAGSPYRIADVTVPASWSLADGSAYAADPAWLAVAQELAADGAVPFEHCTVRPAAPGSDPICLLHAPQIIVGGNGESDDPFGDTPFACQPNGGDVIGCDAASPSASAVSAVGHGGGLDGGASVAVDMETAAIAREAAAAGVPFIAFRAVSDGEGDPLGLPGFPAQFFTYYRLAAHNAAAATIAFLERL